MHNEILIAGQANNFESSKVRELYPQYLREAATNVVSFLEEYYNYMNRIGFPSYELQHVIAENDIDETSAKYLDAIQGEIAKIVPNSAVIERNVLYKRIVHYYKIKGTPESIDLFFKIFFDSLAEVYYPNKDLFKLSDGDFSPDTKYFITSNIRYTAENAIELLNDNGLSISPTNQPILGDNFIVSFTALLNPVQKTDNSYLFTTNGGTLDTTFYRGKFDLRRDTSGSFLWVKQDHSSAQNPRFVRFTEDIFDGTWKNVRISYSTNSNDLNLAKVDASNFTLSNSSYTTLNQTYTKDPGGSGVWEYGTDIDFKPGKVTAFRNRSVNQILEGQEYEISDNTDNGNGVTDFTTYGATDSLEGTIFIANSTSAAADTTDGLVKHRPNIWHFEESGTIKYVDRKIDDLHEQGTTVGSNRITVTSVDDIVLLKFLDYTSGESVETADITVFADGKIIAEETIPHNGGYTNPTDAFSIFAYNLSRGVTDFDIRGRLGEFKIEGATSNNFEYRFTSLDAAGVNRLNDWSNSSNVGKIQIGKIGVADPVDATLLDAGWQWDNESTSYGPLPDSLHPLPKTSSYDDRGGFLSSEKKIQDSEFWQDFSYQISTKTSPALWQESYSRLVHPSGMKFFVLLLIEIINRSRWTEILSYISLDDNPESWYNVLIPPFKRTIDPELGFHTPKYQPGWLSSAQRAIVIAIAELQNNNELLDPYVNNFVFSAENSFAAKMKLVNRVDKNGFKCSNNRSDTNNRFSVIGFPLTRKMKNGELIRMKFTATTGNTASPMVALLHDKNDVGEQLFDIVKFTDDYNNDNIDNALFDIETTGLSPFGNAPNTTDVFATPSNGVLKIGCNNTNPTQRYAATVRYGNNTGNQNTGLEDGKTYTLTGEYRVTKSGALGTARAKVDIADFEATFESTSSVFEAFELTSINFPANPSTQVSAQFFDLGINSGSSQEGVLNSGEIEVEFRNIRLVENPEKSAVVRKFESGRCLDVTGGTLLTDKGHQIGSNLSSQEIDITLKSTSDDNQFIAFIDGASTTGRTIDIEGFTIIDVDRNDYSAEQGAESLSLVSVAGARYNRTLTFDREVNLGAELLVRNIPFRDSYVFNDYINGEGGEHNPRFWLDERSLSGTGWPGFNIDVFTLSYTEGIISEQPQANISNPHEAYIKVVVIPISVTGLSEVDATINQPFTYQITAEQEGIATTNFVVSDIINKPSWITINENTGEMTGTPPIGSEGLINDFTFKLETPDGSKSLTFNLNITVVVTPINIADPGLIIGTLGTAISDVTLTADQSVSLWEIASTGVYQDLPLGLSLDSNTGVISGTPYESQEQSWVSNPTWPVNIKVTSNDGAHDERTITFDLERPTPVPLTTSTTDFEILKNQSFTHTIATANDSAVLSSTNTSLAGVNNELDAEIATSFTLTSGTLPPGLSLNSSTGVISGTPTVAGVYGDNNDGTEAGSSTPIVIDYKWLGIQKLGVSNPNDMVDHNFIVRDTVPIIRNISSGSRVSILIYTTDGQPVPIYWGDDTFESSTGVILTHAYS